MRDVLHRNRERGRLVGELAQPRADIGVRSIATLKNDAFEPESQSIPRWVNEKSTVNPAMAKDGSHALQIPAVCKPTLKRQEQCCSPGKRQLTSEPAASAQFGGSVRHRGARRFWQIPDGTRARQRLARTSSSAPIKPSIFELSGSVESRVTEQHIVEFRFICKPLKHSAPGSVRKRTYRLAYLP